MVSASAKFGGGKVDAFLDRIWLIHMLGFCRFLFPGTRPPLTNFWLMCRSMRVGGGAIAHFVFASLCFGIDAHGCGAIRRRPPPRQRHRPLAVLRRCRRGGRLAAPIATRCSHGSVAPAQPAGLIAELGFVGVVVGVAQSIQGQVDQGTAVRQGTRSMATGAGLARAAWALALSAVGSAARLAHGAGAVADAVRVVVLVARKLGAGAFGLGAGGVVAVLLRGVVVAGTVVAMDGFPGRWLFSRSAGAGLYQSRCVVGQCVAPDPAEALDGLGLG